MATGARQADRHRDSVPTGGIESSDALYFGTGDYSIGQSSRVGTNLEPAGDHPKHHPTTS